LVCVDEKEFWDEIKLMMKMEIRFWEEYVMICFVLIVLKYLLGYPVFGLRIEVSNLLFSISKLFWFIIIRPCKNDSVWCLSRQ